MIDKTIPMITLYLLASRITVSHIKTNTSIERRAESHPPFENVRIRQNRIRNGNRQWSFFLKKWVLFVKHIEMLRGMIRRRNPASAGGNTKVEKALSVPSRAMNSGGYSLE
jgi:hypothetical protein